jgi:hypothetical protein
MANLWIAETYVNEDEGVRYGESGPCETAYEDRGALYRSLKREYGAKVRKMYRDVKDGPPQHIGWCFTKRAEYEGRVRDGDPKTYLRTVWVEVLASDDVRTVRRSYATL